LGLLYATVHNYERAYQYVKEALKLNQQHLNSYMLLTLLSTAMGDHKKAGIILEELLSNNKHPLLFVFK